MAVGRNASELSYPRSEASYATTTRTTKSTKRRAKAKIEATPLCPRIRGLCALMILFNLALILICLGFTLVLQFFEPGYVWYIGVYMLVFGFVTLVGSFIYCVIICQEHRSRVNDDLERGRYYEDDRGSVRTVGTNSKLYHSDYPLYWNDGSSSEINYDNKSGKSINGNHGNNHHHATHIATHNGTHNGTVTNNGGHNGTHGSQHGNQYYEDRERF